MTRRRVGFSTIAVVIASLVGATPAGAKVVPIRGLEPRSGPATALLGKKLFLFGGLSVDRSGGSKNSTLKFLNDGAIVNVRTGDRDDVPDAPFAPKLSSPRAVAIDGDVLVIGTSCKPTTTDDGYVCAPGTPAAAMYNVSQRSWATVKVPKALDLANLFAEPLGATSDGRAVLQVRFGDISKKRPTQYWTYSAKEDQWTQLPDAQFRDESACFSNDELVLLRVRYEENGVVTDEDRTPFGRGSYKAYVQPSLAILDLNSDTAWKPSTTDSGVIYTDSPPTISCLDGTVMLVSSINWATDLRLYDAETDGWSIPASAPAGAGSPATGIFSFHRVWTGTELIVLPSDADVGEPAFAYNPTTDTWRDLPDWPAETGGAQWNGSAVVGYQDAIPIHRGLNSPPERVPAGVYRYVP